MLSVAHVVLTQNFAGVERHVTVLANEQVARGFQVRVLGGDAIRMRQELSSEVNYLALASFPEATLKLRSAVKRADLLHVHMTAAESAAVIATAGHGTPIVTTRHFAARRASRVGPLLRYVVSRRMTAQIAVSRFVADNIDGRSTVVYAGVAPRTFVGHAARDRSVLMAQRLEAEKDTGLGLVAFRESGLADSGWVLRVAGSGKMLSELEAEASRLGLSASVDFLGFRHDVDRLMARCGIFLATAPAEPFGLSVAEAMASGTPVVAAGGGGHIESVGQFAEELLFTPGDAQDAASRLVHLSREPAIRDQVGLRLRVGQRSIFTPAHQHEMTEEVYGTVMA